MADGTAGYRQDPRGDRVADGGPADGAPVHVARRRADERAEGEVAALLAGAGPHLLRLLDIGSAPNGDLLLVVESLPHGLPRLLGVAGWPTVGEAVTVLAPIAQAVAAMHSAGVLHGRIAAAAIRLDDDGRPVLTDLRDAHPIGPLDGVEGDEQALRELAHAVLTRCGGAGDALAHDVASGRPSPAALAELLFRLAPPEPVRLHPVPALADSADPVRLGRLVAVERTVPVEDGPRPRWRTALARACRPLAAVRPRVWFAAAASVLLLGAGVVLLPSHSQVSDAAQVASASASAAPRLGPRPRAAKAVSGADPVAAGAALLDARARCITTARSACLARADADGSPALADDRAALSGSAPAVPAAATGLALVRRDGSTALLTAGRATVLLVREPDGWRIRDIVADRSTP